LSMGRMPRKTDPKKVVRTWKSRGKPRKSTHYSGARRNRSCGRCKQSFNTRRLCRGANVPMVQCISEGCRSVYCSKCVRKVFRHVPEDNKELHETFVCLRCSGHCGSQHAVLRLVDGQTVMTLMRTNVLSTTRVHWEFNKRINEVPSENAKGLPQNTLRFVDTAIKNLQEAPRNAPTRNTVKPGDEHHIFGYCSLTVPGVKTPDGPQELLVHPVFAVRECKQCGYQHNAIHFSRDQWNGADPVCKGCQYPKYWTTVLASKLSPAEPKLVHTVPLPEDFATLHYVAEIVVPKPHAGEQQPIHSVGVVTPSEGEQQGSDFPEGYEIGQYSIDELFDALFDGDNSPLDLSSFDFSPRSGPQ